MGPFCIDAAVLGTKLNLVCATGSFSWVNKVPIDVWHLDGHIKPSNDKCLDSLLKLAHIDIDLSPPEKFVAAYSSLVPGDVQIPWQKVMPLLAHRAFTENIINQINGAQGRLPVSYFMGTWVPGNHVIGSLQRAKIDPRALNALTISRSGNVRAIETFEPDQGGFARSVKYDRFGSLTGRLTVASGPNIMTLNKDMRKIITPTHPMGCIAYLDFQALEVRILLYEAGKRCDVPDLYSFLADEFGRDRRAVKGAVISELYGSSKATLGHTLGMEGKELDAFVKRIRSYFNVKELLKRVKKQFVETGFIINRYGRPVKIDNPMNHIMVNYYTQSTGADVALLGFKNIIGDLEVSAPKTRPVFLLHDALILDVHPDDIETIKSITNVKVPGYVQKFYIKPNFLS